MPFAVEGDMQHLKWIQESDFEAVTPGPRAGLLFLRYAVMGRRPDLADLESGLGPALAVFARKDGKLRLVYLQSVSL